MTVLAMDIGAVAAHLRRALTAHRVWCRANGVAWPAALDDLGAILDSAGQSRTDVDILDEVRHDAGVLLLDFDETARRLGVSRRTVQRLVATGELPVVLLGSQRRVHVEDLAAFASDLRANAEVRTTSAAEVRTR